MRKRLAVLIILFILTLMLTALVFFAQPGDEGTVPLPSAAVLSENSGNPGYNADSVPSDGSSLGGTGISGVSDDSESYKDEEITCDPEENTCEEKRPDPEEQSNDSPLKDADSDVESGKQDIQNETESIQTKSRQLMASDVSWHMNFNVDCVSSGCIALSDRSAGMYVSACNDGGGEYRSVNFSPVGHTGKFISYYVSFGDSPSLGNTNGTAIQNPSSSFSYGPVPVHTCVTAVFESEFDTPSADYTQYKRFEFKPPLTTSFFLQPNGFQ